MKATSGIYAIKDSAGTVIYVGSSTNMKARQRTHLANLRHAHHSNYKLQAAWDNSKSGFVFCVLEYVDKKSLVTREAKWMDKYQSESLCNLLPAERHDGYRLSERMLVKRIKPYPAFHNKKTGEIIPAGKNLKALCVKRGWNLSAPYSLVAGKRHTMGDWHVKGDEYTKKESHLPTAAKQYPGFKNYRSGEIIPPGKNLAALCRNRGMNTKHMSSVITGNRKSCLGWTLLESSYAGRIKSYPALQHQKTGEIISRGVNISALCRERGFEKSSVCRLVAGVIPQYKGWVRI